MRVLHVIPSMAARTGGPPVAVVESALALRDCGVESVVFATDMAEPASARTRARVTLEDMPDGASDVDVRLFPARAPRRLAYAADLARELARQTRSFDVLHIHSLYLYPQFAAYRAARRTGVPYVVSPRGALDPYLRRQNRPVKALAGVAFQDAMLAHASTLHLTSVDEERLTDDIAPDVARAVIPNGIRWPQFQTLPPGDEFRRAHLRGHDGPLVLFLGRMARKKGIDLLVRAFALLRAAVPDAMLALAGPDDECLRPELEALATDLGVADRIAFTGMLRGDDRLGALAACDVWALPSHSENFGIAVAEALAAGCAVVVAPGVNIAPEMAAGGAGIVADATPVAFAREITALLQDDARRAALASTARTFARRYDWGAVAPRLARMYEEVAA